VHVVFEDVATLIVYYIVTHLINSMSRAVELSVSTAVVLLVPTVGTTRPLGRKKNLKIR
jgi:hypothetical protein